MFSWCSFVKRFLASRGSRRAGLVLASDFQRTSAPVSPLFVPASLPKAGAKVLPFYELASTFFIYFSTFSYFTVCQREKSFTRRKNRSFAHLIIYNNASPTGQKSVLDMVYCRLTIVENDRNNIKTSVDIHVM